MRNLQLLYSRTAPITIKNINCHSISGRHDDQIVLANNTEIARLDENDTEEFYPVVSSDDKIVGIRYITINNEMCVATESGDVIVYNLSTKTTETVTCCAGGLKAMGWADGEDVVAFVTGDNLLVVMNCCYDPIGEASLNDNAFGDEEFVNVGWGKKETQFHGSEGKAAARKQPEQIQINDIEQLDQSVLIEWRVDDLLFAVSYVGRNGRMFKVFDNTGVLKYTSEIVAGLEASISWRPDRNWIAIPHILPNKYTIGLFEKNGLRHREIVLPFKQTDEQVKQLAWSKDSEVLAVYAERGTQSTIYLYTMGNYHWYQKQTLVFDGKCQVIRWTTHQHEGNVLHIVQDQQYHMYRWNSAVTRSNGLTPDDQAIVGVIDGSQVLLTNLRGAIIPPPMCAATLKHSSGINRLGFIRQVVKNEDSNQFFILDATNTLSTFQCVIEKNAERNTNLLQEASLKNAYKFADGVLQSISPSHLIWLNDEQIFFCNYFGTTTTIYLAKLNDSTKTIEVLDTMQIDGIVGNCTASDTNARIICHLYNGDFLSIEIVDSLFVHPDDPDSLTLFKLDGLSRCIDCITINGELKIVSLYTGKAIYVDDIEINIMATSFLLNGEFLLASTLDDLAFIRMKNPSAGVIDRRRLESGARLVTSVSHDSRTILQMPRGNLEAIQSRILSLHLIGHLLDVHSYHKAFDLLRKQRINLNLLVDHNPSDFLAHIPDFVRDIGNAQWLNLFLADLQNEDVTITMYPGNYQHLKDRKDSYETAFNGRDKIDVICERCCEYFAENENMTYLLPMITAHVKRKNIEAALERIWQMRLTELQTKSVGNSAQDALKYLLYLVNVNDLYDVALGMYDFDLVLFVAQKSQKDPKEYIPFLNELKQLEENYRKFRIDNHLKRYENALGHIVKCGVEKLDECLELIEKHQLYTSAIRLFKPSDECYNDVVLQYADYLRSKGIFYEASLMYERGADFKQAVLSAKHTLDWKRCSQLARKAGYSNEETEKFCLSLLPALQENGKHHDASSMAKFFNLDNKQLIKILCDGRQYREAIFEANNLDDSSIPLITEHLTEYANQTLTKVQADNKQFNAYVSRLDIVRKQKAEKLLNGDDDDDLADFDMFSDTTSMNSSRLSGSSRHSGRSRRSSKNRRKHERKLMSLKEGNPFEDIALIDALYTLSHKIYDQQPQIRDLLQVLIDVGLDGHGVELQTAFQLSLTDITKALDSVWIPELMVSGEIKFDDIADYFKLQQDQHYAMIKPHQRTKPLLTPIDWTFEILK